MNALLVEPNAIARKVQIGNELKDLQNAVGGLIQAIYPFDDPVAIICNDEGKLLNMPFNRALYTEDGEIYDIIAGSFLITGLTEDNFGSLSEDLAQKYMSMFFVPQLFIHREGKLLVLP